MSAARDAIAQALLEALAEAPEAELEALHKAVCSYEKAYPTTVRRIRSGRDGFLVLYLWRAMEEAFEYRQLPGEE
jgi:hypothetical protein